jgi:hypothetical protein
MLFLGVLLPIQYAICVGLPPGLCKKYPLNNIDIKLQRWLFLPNYESPPVSKKIMADFFLICFCGFTIPGFQNSNGSDFLKFF